MTYGRQLSVSEMKRVLKPGGQLYISVGGPPFGYVDQDEWQQILAGFKVKLGGTYREKWAVLSLK